MLQLPGRPYTGGSTHGGRKRKTAGLAAVGLRLNMHLVMIFTPSQVAPPGMEDWWEQTKRHDGLIIAGRPYSIEEKSLETNFEGVGTVFPVGGKQTPGRLRRNCENQDSDGAGTTGTTNGESTSGTAGETSGQRVYCTTAPQRKRRNS